MSTVEAVIVAGGLGTRLLPLTEHRPKHLLPLAGQPFVCHQIAKLAAAGVRRIVLATSYHADRFEPTLGDGSAWGVELVYVTEDELLGTAGAIRNAASALRGDDDPVVILNGDILSGHDLAAQLAHHRAHSADVTLHLVTVEDARAFGCVPTDEDDRVTAFLEKSADPVSPQINAGCYLFEPEVILSIPQGRAVSVERETFPALLGSGRRVLGHVDQSYWMDVGTPAALVRASADVVRGVVPTPAYKHEPGESWVHPAARLGAGASLTAGSAIGALAEIGAGAVVEASVICEGAVVGAGACVSHSVLGTRARVGDNAVLSRTALGDDAEIEAGIELVEGQAPH
jgi:mannose-1-phosphate guanylyltransferase